MVAPKEIMRRFKTEALKKGYTVKVIGDFAYRTDRRRKNCYGFIRLISGNPYKVVEFRQK